MSYSEYERFDNLEDMYTGNEYEDQWIPEFLPRSAYSILVKKELIIDSFVYIEFRFNSYEFDYSKFNFNIVDEEKKKEEVIVGMQCANNNHEGHWLVYESKDRLVYPRAYYIVNYAKKKACYYYN